IPRSLLRGFRALTKSVPVGAKFRNTPSACSGDRNFEDFDSLFPLLMLLLWGIGKLWTMWKYR
ncbi:MAG: hypothetical protein WBD62_18570, partial [Anaerolineales bacterium]